VGRYVIETKPAFDRDFDKLPLDSQRRLSKRIEALAGEPRPPGVEKLSGATDLRRLRVGTYRVIYQIDDGVLRVLLVKVGHRREVHR
jgi:mRNA interferase RelE/StbE